MVRLRDRMRAICVTERGQFVWQNVVNLSTQPFVSAETNGKLGPNPYLHLPLPPIVERDCWTDDYGIFPSPARDARAATVEVSQQTDAVAL